MGNPSLSLKDIGRIYLDHNATTPPLKSVVEHLPEWAKSWGNPSSIHWSGRGPKNLVRESRQAVSKLIRCHPLEVIFTSGGSEANNLVVKGLYEIFRHSPRQECVTSSVEHPSVIESFRALESRGIKVHYVPVNRDGELDLDFYTKVLSERTALVSIMYANNETGTVFPIEKLAAEAHAVGALFHTDAVQTLGKVVVDVQKWGVDFATFSAHKFYALKGCGVLYARKGQRLVSQIHGGGQERGRRAGTENTLSIAALGHVAGLVDQVAEKYVTVRDLRDKMEALILKSISGVTVTGAGSGVKRIPNTSSLVVDGVDGESLLMNLDIEGVSVSTGAACSSGNPEPSPVLLAMGLKRFEAQSSLRLSLGWDTTDEEITKFVEILNRVVSRLRKLKAEHHAGGAIHV